MNGNCLDIGTIQAFLDGETRPEEAVKISEHVADCDTCTLLLAQAEEESSMVYSVLDRELNTLVPTQRLWTRINDSICEEKTSSSFLQRISAFISTSFLSPSFTAAAGILMVVGMLAVVWNMNPVPAGTSVTVAGGNMPDAQPASKSAEPGPVTILAAEVPASGKTPAVVKTNLSEKEIARTINADYRVGPKAPRPVPAAQYLPGEESYIKTIGDLQQGVTVQNASLSASSQVAFARDMAVVDDSIKKMRDVVRKNPRNQAAKQVLYSSYQDKIDLLRSSAQSNELMASLQ